MNWQVNDLFAFYTLLGAEKREKKCFTRCVGESQRKMWKRRFREIANAKKIVKKVSLEVTGFVVVLGDVGAGELLDSGNLVGNPWGELEVSLEL
jgi:hypothetical protein